jgi:hypothetical protein
MKYSIDIIKANGERTQEKQLTAKTDRGALRQAAKHMKTASFQPSDKVVLLFFRASDGCSGVLVTL